MLKNYNLYNYSGWIGRDRGSETVGEVEAVRVSLEPQWRWLNLHVPSEEEAQSRLGSGTQNMGRHREIGNTWFWSSTPTHSGAHKPDSWDTAEAHTTLVLSIPLPSLAVEPAIQETWDVVGSACHCNTLGGNTRNTSSSKVPQNLEKSNKYKGTRQHLWQKWWMVESTASQISFN